MNVTLTINGLEYTTIVRPDEYLLDTLRRLNFLSVKKGCETTSCGVCTVLVDDKPIPSCSYLSARAEGHFITTVEGIKSEAELIADCMGAEGADQCGFCNPGFTLTVYSMKLQKLEATDDVIRHYLVGNLCRCSGYLGQLAAVKSYLEVK